LSFSSMFFNLVILNAVNAVSEDEKNPDKIIKTIKKMTWPYVSKFLYTFLIFVLTNQNILCYKKALS
jgi:hypothetical protein